jgi:hypothetical protein
VVKVCVTMPAAIGDSAEFVADVRALEAAGAHMVGVDADGDDGWILLGAIAAVTGRVKIWARSAEPPAVVHKLSRGRVVVGQPPGETWVAIPTPSSRDAWAAAIQEHTAAGATGVIVPWDPRLIDLLRNPEPEDRSDLLMSTG